MSQFTEFLVRHGGAVLFLAVFLEQAGAPLPAAPWLLAAGALSVSGRLSSLMAVAVTLLACLVADGIWFYLGRRYGNRVLGLLCRISLEPDSCVRRTQNVFTKYGMRGVIAAKFVPGISTLVPPLAGNSGVSTSRFFFFDGLGSLLYVGGFLVLGMIFSNQLDQVIDALASLGSSALALLAGLFLAYLGYKFFQRQRLLHELRTARITVDELHEKQEAGENPVILDLRASAELDQDPSLIRGALHMTIEEVERRQHEIPRDRDVILYCSCPNEAGSARMALLLHRNGITRVRPLLGGIEAWRKRDYPTELRAAAVARGL